MIKSKDISVVIQGPITDVTDKTLENVRKFFPDGQIIVSTWKGSNYKNNNADIIIENKDPGGYPLFDDPKILNASNRQIVSTLAGLKVADRKYALKMRSDMFFEHIGFLDYFNKFKKRSEENKILEERVIISTYFAPNPKIEPKPYHPSDWFFFGLTQDLINIFDIPLCPEPETARYFETHKRPKIRYDAWVPAFCRYTAEQYIWFSFLKKHINLDFDHCFDIEKNNIDLSEQIFANNSVLVDAKELGYNSYKHKGLYTEFEMYQKYSHFDWLKMYKKHCDKKFKLPLLDKEKLKRVFYAIKRSKNIKKNIKAFLNLKFKKTVVWDYNN